MPIPLSAPAPSSPNNAAPAPAQQPPHPHQHQQPMPPQPPNLETLVARLGQLVEAVVRRGPASMPHPGLGPGAQPSSDAPMIGQQRADPTPDQATQTPPPRTETAPPSNQGMPVAPPLTRRLTRRFTRQTADGPENVVVEMSVQAVPVIMPHPQQQQGPILPPQPVHPSQTDLHPLMHWLNVPPQPSPHLAPQPPLVNAHIRHLTAAVDAAAAQRDVLSRTRDASDIPWLLRYNRLIEQQQQQGQERVATPAEPEDAYNWGDHDAEFGTLSTAVDAAFADVQRRPRAIAAAAAATSGVDTAAEDAAAVADAMRVDESMDGSESPGEMDIAELAFNLAIPDIGPMPGDTPQARSVTSDDTTDGSSAAATDGFSTTATDGFGSNVMRESPEPSGGVANNGPAAPNNRTAADVLDPLELLLPGFDMGGLFNRLVANLEAPGDRTRLGAAGMSLPAPIPTVPAPQGPHLHGRPMPQTVDRSSLPVFPFSPRPRSASPRRANPLYPEHRHTPAHSPEFETTNAAGPRPVRPLPRTGAAALAQPPAQGGAMRTQQRVRFEGELPRFNFPVAPTGEPGEIPDIPPPRPDDPTNGGGFNRLLQFITQAMNSGVQNLFTGVPPDWDRARTLLEALDVVSPGLLRRLDRVEDGGGGKCAVCWAYLRDKPDVDEDMPDATTTHSATPAAGQAGTASAGAGPAPQQHPGTAPAERHPPCPMDDSTVLSLPCTHTLHAACIYPWLANHTTCPVCRFDLDPDSTTLRRSRPRMGTRTATNAASPAATNQTDPASPPGLPGFLIDNLLENIFGAHPPGGDSPAADQERPENGGAADGSDLRPGETRSTRRTHQIMPGMWLTVEEIHHVMPIGAGVMGIPFPTNSNNPTRPLATQPEPTVPPTNATVNPPPAPHTQPSRDSPIPPPPQGTTFGFVRPGILFAGPLMPPNPPTLRSNPAATASEPTSRASTPTRPLKRKYTPPSGTQTLRERIEGMEEKAGLRCSAPSCAYGPADDDDPNGTALMQPTQYAIHNDNCRHNFHATCLVTACRVQGHEGPASSMDEKVAVTCPICRGEHGTGWINEAVWEEGEVEGDV
ncbi:hypothetical protein CALCODRAFT_500588 [Calocera cornea HHB12733]|uniref:RING-type domain-containing protein n=1 Tax=Calocera cornea HHB12733 TaxID=1353952 RepID=A0A165E085_9BASI|nr:hypothetical protein CALCODRAFT_500588 [Calocera cornea HHB12733]